MIEAPATGARTQGAGGTIRLDLLPGVLPPLTAFPFATRLSRYFVALVHRLQLRGDFRLRAADHLVAVHACQLDQVERYFASFLAAQSERDVGGDADNAAPASARDPHRRNE